MKANCSIDKECENIKTFFLDSKACKKMDMLEGYTQIYKTHAQDYTKLII